MGPGVADSFDGAGPDLDARAASLNTDPAGAIPEAGRPTRPLQNHPAAKPRYRSRSVDQAGDKLDGRYRLIAKIGSGGYGVVYRGRDLATRGEVAVKVMKQAADPALIQRFEREAVALARLRGAAAVFVHAVQFSSVEVHRDQVVVGVAQVKPVSRGGFMHS